MGKFETHEHDVEACVLQVVQHLEENGYITAAENEVTEETTGAAV